MHKSSIVKNFTIALLGCFLLANHSLAQTDNSLKRFNSIDTNSDKQLSKAEFKVYVDDKLPDFNQFEKLVAQLDADKNGSLSIKEFHKRRPFTQKLIDEEASGREPMEFAETFNRRYLTKNPLVGDPIGSLGAFDELGNEFDFNDLKGKYTVINFGCLT